MHLTCIYWHLICDFHWISSAILLRHHSGLWDPSIAVCSQSHITLSPKILCLLQTSLPYFHPSWPDSLWQFWNAQIPVQVLWDHPGNIHPSITKHHILFLLSPHPYFSVSCLSMSGRMDFFISSVYLNVWWATVPKDTSTISFQLTLSDI